MSRLALVALAAGVPLVAYLATLGGSGYWLDAGEFVAASAMLDIAHPPGHPVALIWGKLWCLLPLGSLTFRVGLGQAVAGAAAAGFLFAAICECVGRLPGVSRELADLSALAGTWLAMLAFPNWFQAVRPEVYALHGALLLAGAHQLCRLRFDKGCDARPLYVACVCVGLSLANHHFTAFLFFPTLLLAAGQVALRRGIRSLVICAGAGASGLLAYAYLPARALTRPAMNLGDPTSLERFYWVLSARVYAKDLGMTNAQPLAERLIDTLVAVVDAMHVPFVFLALAGAYLGLRRSSTRAVTSLWILTALFAFFFRAWLGPVRGNPDALGYMYAAFAALGALVSVALAAGASVLPAGPRVQRAACVVWAAFALGVLALQLRHAGPRANLANFHAVEAFDDARHAQLPPRAMLIATSPQTVFRHWEDAATARSRPDVLMLPLPFVEYPGTADALVHSDPDLGPVVAQYRRDRLLAADALFAAARRRPVRVELDLLLPTSVYRALVPDGLLHAVTTHAAAPAVGRQHAAGRERVQAALYRRLGGEARENETSRQLLWLHYMDALYFAVTGQRQAAIFQGRQALALHPADLDVQRLVRALAQWPIGRPFDPRPHLMLP